MALNPRLAWTPHQARCSTALACTLPACQMRRCRVGHMPPRHAASAALHTFCCAEFKPHYQYTVTGRMRKKNAPDRPKVGSNATVNGSRLALFRHGDQVFATDAACPHQGGDLAAGDIEDLDGSLCVSCPVHGFSFDLQRGGVSVVPCGTYQLRVFPTKVDAEGVLSVALPGGMHPAMFDEDF